MGCALLAYFTLKASHLVEAAVCVAVLAIVGLHAVGASLASRRGGLGGALGLRGLEPRTSRVAQRDSKSGATRVVWWFDSTVRACGAD
jgi:hypothetical protein